MIKKQTDRKKKKKKGEVGLKSANLNESDKKKKK